MLLEVMITLKNAKEVLMSGGGATLLYGSESKKKVKEYVAVTTSWISRAAKPIAAEVRRLQVQPKQKKAETIDLHQIQLVKVGDHMATVPISEALLAVEAQDSCA
ncbi:MAG: hypothetical protein EZS28_011889 [Streblomastix strix]|uniref:Uncharacterized protein n=1 Tax=Streblomastix strix TaxID=222440 RepID=A0A5J4WDI4_9EUKA|nr:MAG: hypothetical protein EZS28_011889 [Streblomastix strix]